MLNTTKAAISLGIVGSFASMAFASTAFAAPAATSFPDRRPTPAATASPAVASERLAKDLTWMRDEERLARDVYTALAAKYDGAAPFANIAKAEQQHYDAVGTLLARYGVADPSAGASAGTYAEPELQELYNRLMEQGSKSLADAYDVGIAIEKADLADLKDALARTTESDVTRVFTNLSRGSEQHLAAFEAAKAGDPITHDQMARQGGSQGMAPGTGLGQRRANGTGQGMGPGLGQGNGLGDGTGDCVNR